ncbi:hypothetical protein V5799_017578 [Amblyomma americanum]|uniref:Uncharacterized protein n=1 Tax=Amblyomma americanum TaxID=6943 RepID=A0AAQ4E7B1_AMBAM
MFPSRPRRSVVICLSSSAADRKLECDESPPPSSCPAALLSMGTLEELRDAVLKQERIIHDLRQVITLRDEEILQLRSQLDKFQSVLIPYNARYSRSGRRKERAQGISAEPQSLRSIQDLIQTKFQEYPKSDRSVLLLRSARSCEPSRARGAASHPDLCWRFVEHAIRACSAESSDLAASCDASLHRAMGLSSSFS